MTTPLRFPVLSHRITVASVARAVQTVARRARKPMLAALYQASAGSSLLAHAIAEVYPTTYCAHPRCERPMAHAGEHVPGAAS